MLSVATDESSQILHQTWQQWKLSWHWHGLLLQQRWFAPCSLASVEFQLRVLARPSLPLDSYCEDDVPSGDTYFGLFLWLIQKPPTSLFSLWSWIWRIIERPIIWRCRGYSHFVVVTKRQEVVPFVLPLQLPVPITDAVIIISSLYYSSFAIGAMTMDNGRIITFCSWRKSCTFYRY